MSSRSVFLRAFSFLLFTFSFCSFISAQEYLIGDRATGTVGRYSTSGAFLGNLITGFDKPSALAIIPGGSGPELLVASAENFHISRYNLATGAYINEFASNNSGFSDIAYDPVSQKVFVSDVFTGAGIQRYSLAGGAPELSFGGGQGIGYGGVAIGPDNNVYAAQLNIFTPGDAVRRYDQNGTPLFAGNSFTATAPTSFGGGNSAISFLSDGTFLVAQDLIFGGLDVVRYNADGTYNSTVLSQYNPDGNANPNHDGTASTTSFLVNGSSLIFSNSGNNNTQDLNYGPTLFNGFVSKYNIGTGPFNFTGNYDKAFITSGTAFLPTDIILSPIPEPSSLALVGLCSAGMIYFIRQRRKSPAHA